MARDNFLIKGLYSKHFTGNMAGWETQTDNDHHSVLLSEFGGRKMPVAPSYTLYKALRYYAKISAGVPVDAGYGCTSDGMFVSEILTHDGRSRSVDICGVTRRGMIYAVTKNLDAGGIKGYTVGEHERGGTAICLAIMPYFLENEEAGEDYDRIRDDLLREPTDPCFEGTAGDEFRGILTRMTENFYYQFLSDLDVPTKYAARMRLKATNAGKCREITEIQLSKHKYSPEESTIHGQFVILVDAPETKAGRKSTLSFKDARAMYGIEQEIPPEALSMMVTEEDGWVLDPVAEKIAKATKRTSLRNFLITGPSGGGKSTISKQVAAIRNVPRAFVTCSANTEIFDFTCQVVPVEAGTSGAVDIYNSDGGYNLDGICSAFGYPVLEEIQFDPEDAYLRIVGKPAPGPISEMDVIRILFDRVAKKLRTVEAGGSTQFKVVETPVLQAIQNGWVVEIQEPTTILQQGTLVGLNGLLDDDGKITLPNGKVAKRHPDTVIIMTTNLSYFGCDNLNQSVISRMGQIFEVELPRYEDMAERAMKYTGYTDRKFAVDMAKLVCEVAEYCEEHGIQEGSCDQRALNAWMEIVKAEGKEEAAESLFTCVLMKASLNKGDRQMIYNAVVETSKFSLGEMLM